MRSRLHHARAVMRTPISRPQLSVVAVASLVATVVILVASPGRNPDAAALAALRAGNYVVHVNGSGSRAPTDALGAQSSPASGSASAQNAAGSAGAVASDPGVLDTSSPGIGMDTTTAGPSNPSPAGARAKAGHVFVISLTTTSFESAFGSTSPARYLNHRLRSQGTLLGGYESLGPRELPDQLALISGQPPNPATQADCTTFQDFPAGAKPGDDGSVQGSGCVYPNTALTVADQVNSAGKSWRAYVDGIGSSACPHPDSGGADSTEPPGAGPQYDTRHNPFIYFHSLLDLGGCASNDVSIDKLAGDLRRAQSTPTYAFLAPGLCADASASVCAAGGPSGMAAEDSFLRRWVPKILRSAGYRRDGVLIIAFSLAPAAGSSTTSAAGAPTGALVLSPHAAKAKTVSASYDAYSVLRTTEDLLALKPLAEAAHAKSFAKLAPATG